MCAATRDDVVEYAQSLAGLGADPADPEQRAAYIALIAPREGQRRGDEMASMSGCEIVQRAVLRKFIYHALLEGLYRTGHAGSDLLAIGFEAHAAHQGRSHAPERGDILLIGGGSDGGGPEHAYTALDASQDPDDEDALIVIGLDGGQKDEREYQLVTIREHRLKDGRDRAVSSNDPGGALHRIVRWVLDVDAILARFPRP